VQLANGADSMALVPLTGMTASSAISQVSARKMTPGCTVPAVAQVPGTALAIGGEKIASVNRDEMLDEVVVLISLTWKLNKGRLYWIVNPYLIVVLIDARLWLADLVAALLAAPSSPIS
jgi:hypothetical protein